MSIDADNDNEVILLQHRSLRRSYSAICKICKQRCHSDDSSNRLVVCFFCSLIKIQNTIRSYIIYKRYKNLLIKKELLYRYFFKQKNINGYGLVENICKYL